MEINFIPSKKDLLDTGRTGFRSKKVSYVLFVGIFYVLPILLGLFFLLFVRPLEIVYIAFITIMPLVMYYAMRRIMLQHLNAPSLKGNHRYNLCDDEIELSGPGFNNKLEWNLIDRCVRSKTTYLLYSGKLPAISIPLRVLSLEQRDKLDKILSSKKL